MSEKSSGSSSAPSPILRWAGGKRWLVPQLTRLAASSKPARFHEPFLGGAAVFFGLGIGAKSFLSDSNAELMSMYEQVRKNPAKVAAALVGHVNTKEHYYEVRSKSYSDPIERAAAFIFMNHTSFNGVYRVNLSGVYNVPYGYRKSPAIPNLSQLTAASRALTSAELSVRDFDEAIELVKKGDLIFLDPPYTVAHDNNGFVKYNQKLFSFEDQKRLSLGIDLIRRRGAKYILTNAAHESIATLFEKGDVRIELERGNTIGGRSASRGSAREYLFTNLRSPSED